jgi:sarcosine oxidase subunit beta
VWGYAHGADERGVHIHQMTEVTGIDVENGRVTGVQTNRGRIKTGVVMNATSGFCTLLNDMVGVRMPITSHPLQACVSESLKPFLNCVIVSGSLHVYVSQSDRGELVMGASIDPYTSYSQDSTLGFLESLSQHILELFPFLARVKVLRQWAGVCDMTPDYSPIMGVTPVEGFLVDVGWGTYGFKAGPVSGKRMAELIATGQTPELISAFRLSRFEEGRLVGEKGAASVGH